MKITKEQLNQNTEKAIKLAKELKVLLDTGISEYDIKEVLLEGRCSQCWTPMTGYTCWQCYESPSY